jgi:hypothetical protein
MGLTALLFGTASAQGAAAALNALARSSLCVTEGTVDEALDRKLSVSVPKMLAYVNQSSADAVDIRFTYLGATANELPLASGQSRRQFGLKLRAEDACNLIYAMWRIEPESRLVVSIKRNPGQHSSAECGNRGYQNVKPRFSAPIPPLTPGQSHSLRAELQASQLRVLLDGTMVWQGELGAAAAGLGGPVGVRSDNVRLEFELAATAASSVTGPGCRSGPQESD